MPSLPSRRRKDPRRVAAGVASIFLLAALGWSLPRWGDLRQRAVVDASQTFLLQEDAPGQYSWTLQDGSTARGRALVSQRAIRFDRDDLVELSLADDLDTGARVSERQALAVLRSPRNERRLAEFRAQREALQHQKALLEAGDRPEAIAQARRAVEVARAQRDAGLPEIQRLQELVAAGAAPQSDLDEVLLADQVRSLQIDLAVAGLAVSRSSARPEELSALDAQIRALDARAEEMELLLNGDQITSPIDGLLEVGGNRTVLRVYDLSTVYLRIPVPEADRHRVSAGTLVRFASTAVPQTTFEGAVVDVAEDASTLNGLQIFWASARVDNPELLLRSGMSGVAQLELEGPHRGFMDTLWEEVAGL